MDEIRRITNIVYVRPEELHYQYIPYVVNREIWHDDMGLPNSPHVELTELMMLMIQGPGFDWDVIKKTRYYQDRLHRISMGIGSEKNAKVKMLARYRLLKSIREKGLNKNRSNKVPIIILRQPFWKSRFNCQEPWVEGMEIWDGGGRCAMAHVLGIKSVPAYIYEDAHAGTCKSEKFEKKLKGAYSGINHNTEL